MTKRTGFFLSITAAVLILFLTLQTTDETQQLSTSAFEWLSTHNINVSHSQLRSDVATSILTTNGHKYHAPNELPHLKSRILRLSDGVSGFRCIG